MGVIMTSREEKNKKYVDEIKKEKALKATKIVIIILLIIVIIFGLLFFYARYYETNRLITHEYLINDISIPDDFNGTKIVHFTDLLYGSITKSKLINIEKELNLINPDIVIFTGNIVSKDYSITEDEIELLNNFFKNIPYTIGKYAVSGDNDNQNYHLIMENTNFIVIDNELLNIYNNKSKINLIGINYNDTKEIKQNNNDYTITIINNYDDYNKFNIQSNLVFAGHNLGGEIRLFNIPLLGSDKHLNPYYEENNSKVYISNGIGSIHKLRFGNKPSINVYRLYNN